MGRHTELDLKEGSNKCVGKYGRPFTPIINKLTEEQLLLPHNEHSSALKLPL